MPLLFGYGTFQKADVQLAVFGRLLEWDVDYLAGFELSDLEIDDPDAARRVGATHYVNLAVSLRRDGRVKGFVFDISQAELAAADEYEGRAGYRRTMERLASGRLAWVYVRAA